MEMVRPDLRRGNYSAVQIPKSLFSLLDGGVLQSADFTVLLVIESLCSEESGCKAPYREIALRSNLSNQKVKTSIDKLLELELLKKLVWTDNSGYGYCELRVNWDMVYWAGDEGSI